MEMDICSQLETNGSAFQAVNFMFLKVFREKLMLATNRTECTHLQPSKELTTEAIFILVVVTIFIIFAVLGSLNTAFEFLNEENTDTKNTNNKNVTNNLAKKDWISISRSFLRCFCFVKNGKKLFQTDPDKKQFECLHGIRVISNLCIISYHICLSTINTKRSEELKPFFESSLFKLLSNAYFGVDAFFVLSGLLNAYSFSKEYDKKDGKIVWRHFYFKRFLRLTPAYMIVLGFYTTLLSYTGSGPIWPDYATNPVCKENWWRYLLYINNFELSAKSCMLWCWHLAAEMQVYIVSPIFLIPLIRWQKFGYSLAIIAIFFSGLSSFLITKTFNLIYCSFGQIPLFMDDLETFTDGIWMYADKLYYKPYTRISSYLVGVFLGYYFHYKNFEGSSNRWITLCFGWIGAGVLIWISFFAPLKIKSSLYETALYNTVKHIFFSVGISWIIFVCLTEQGRFINSFLSSKIFLPFSKLSYCAYLIHMVIIQRDNQAAQELEEFSLLSLVFYSFRLYFWTFFFSIPVSLLFEMPVIQLFDSYTKKEKIEKREVRKEKIKKK